MKKNDANHTRRGAVRALSAGAAALALGAAAKKSAAAEAAPAAFELRGIFPESVKAAHPTYSPGILASGSKVLFISGQGPRDYSADPETQVRQTMENICAVLAAAGASWKNVVMVRSYFVNMKRDLPHFRKVRAEFFASPPPASTAVGVTELAIDGLEIEIEAIAII